MHATNETNASGSELTVAGWVRAPDYPCSGCGGRFSNVLIDTFVLGRYWCPPCFDEEYGPDEEPRPDDDEED